MSFAPSPPWPLLLSCLFFHAIPALATDMLVPNGGLRDDLGRLVFGGSKEGGDVFLRAMQCGGAPSGDTAHYLRKLDSIRVKLKAHKGAYGELAKAYDEQNELVQGAVMRFHAICIKSGKVINQLKKDYRGCEHFELAKSTMQEGINAVNAKEVNLKGLAKWFSAGRAALYRQEIRMAKDFPFRYGVGTPLRYGTELEGELRRVFGPEGPLAEMAEDISHELKGIAEERGDLEEIRQELEERLDSCRSMR